MYKKILFLISFILLLNLASGLAKAEKIWGEAEIADTITQPLQTISDATASGGQYITVAAGNNSSTRVPTPAGTATYTITVEEGGVYTMYLRVLCAPDVDLDSADSCWVRIQGASLNIPVSTDDWISNNNLDYDATDNSEEWFWSQVRHYGAYPMDDYIEMTLDPGTYTVEIAYREDGLWIDGFLITNELVEDSGTLPDEIPLELPFATSPEPTNASIEIALDADLGWVPGVGAVTHNLYFGTDAALTDAIVIEGLSVNSYDPGKLEYSTTYYWRVDEVKANSTVTQGTVWSFNTILEGYPILPAEIIEVTASGSYQGEDPNNTCTGLGLDANDTHSADALEMWASQTSIAADDCWIQYEFGKVYKLHDMLVWNYNDAASKIVGAKEVRIETSMDGETWTDLAGVITLNQAPGADGYAANSTVAFEGTIAKYVKIIFVSNFSGFLPFYGLSEVRFSAIPTRAADYSPENEEEDVAVLADLSWKAGRDVDEHYLYLSTDMNAVTEATVDPVILDDASTTQELVIGQTYYMRVDEVNDAEEYVQWDGPVTSFTAVDYIVVDNFEDYNESDEAAVWATWLSGYDSADYGGSYMGLEAPPYVEENIARDDQSGPMIYDNTGEFDFSEVAAQVSDLAAGTDWTIGSPTTLTIWFNGDPCNVVGEDQLYCEIDGEKVVYSGDLGMLIDKSIWTSFDIDLSALDIDLTDVEEITIGIEKVGATGGSGILYIDDVYLSGLAPVVAEAPIYIEAEDYVTISSPMEVNDVLAGASGGQYIHPRAGTDNASNNPPEPNGTATYDVELSAGQYMIYARVSITGGFGGDAFWVRVNGAESDSTLHASGWAQWNTIPAGADWHWEGVYQSVGNGAGPIITWTVPEDGTTTIDIAYRDTAGEPKIDALMIVKVGD